MNVTKAVILARGLGSRMRAADPSSQLSASQSAAADAGVKGMIDVGRPFLDFVISALADAGVTDVCLVIGPEHDVFRNHYGSLDTQRVRIHFAVQEQPLGTANAVAAAAEFTGDDRFIVLNSDNYYPVEVLRQLVTSTGAAAAGFEREALVAHSNIPAQRVESFGIMVSSEAADRPGLWLESMIEKPGAEVLAAHPDARISMNAWVFTPEIYPAISATELSERGEYEITDAVRALVTAGTPLEIVPVAAGVLDMSRRTDIAQVRDALAGIEVVL